MKSVYIVRDALDKAVFACEEYSDALDMAAAVNHEADVAVLAEHIETMPVIETVKKPWTQRDGVGK